MAPNSPDGSSLDYFFWDKVQQKVYEGRHWTETDTGGVLWKKVFLEILQNSLENNCARVESHF